MLFCLLTRASVNKVRPEVEKHIEGKRFQTKLYQRWKKDALKLKKKLISKIKIEKRL